MAHQHADKDAAIARILLLGRVLQIDEADVAAQQLGDLVCRQGRFGAVGRAQAVVVEGDAVDEADEQQRPVRAAFGPGGVVAVVDGQEDVGGVGEVGEGVGEGGGVGGLHEHEGHAGAEKDDVRVGVLGEGFALEVSAGGGGRGGEYKRGGYRRGVSFEGGRWWRWKFTHSSQKAILCSPHQYLHSNTNHLAEEVHTLSVNQSLFNVSTSSFVTTPPTSAHFPKNPPPTSYQRGAPTSHVKIYPTPTPVSKRTHAPPPPQPQTTTTTSHNDLQLRYASSGLSFVGPRASAKTSTPCPPAPPPNRPTQKSTEERGGGGGGGVREEDRMIHCSYRVAEVFAQSSVEGVERHGVAERGGEGAGLGLGRTARDATGG